MTLPYSSATSGKDAMIELQKIVQAFGATSFGSFEDYAESSLTVQFAYRGRRVTVKASAKGYAVALMKTPKRKDTRGPSSRWSESDALKQGQIAVYSMIRDWIKGQITAVECGILSFDAAFLGQILLPDGRTIHERVAESDMLPALEAPK